MNCCATASDTVRSPALSRVASICSVTSGAANALPDRQAKSRQLGFSFSFRQSGVDHGAEASMRVGLVVEPFLESREDPVKKKVGGSVFRFRGMLSVNRPCRRGGSTAIRIGAVVAKQVPMQNVQSLSSASSSIWRYLGSKMCKRHPAMR